jgi:peptidoglycan/LPS O-acetylase OafA/YrhL
MYQGNVSLPQTFCVFNLWFAWCCGAFLADKKALNPGALKQAKYFFFYSIILIALIYLKYKPGNFFIISYQLSILIWTAPMMFILSRENWIRERKNSFLIKILTAIGVSSYSLYLLHEPLIYLKNFLVHKFISDRFQPVGIMVGIIIIPIFAWYNYKYIEKSLISSRRRLVNNG